MKRYVLQIDSIKLPYYVTGRGRPLFMVIGFHSTIKRFMPLIEYLSDYFTIYVPELPGNSTPHPLPMEHTAINYAKIFNKLLTHLKLKNCLLAGFSLGAIIAIRMLQPRQVRLGEAGHVMLVGGIYDSDLFKFPKKFLWAIKILKKTNPNNPIIYKMADFCLHDRGFLKWFLTMVYKNEPDLPKVIEHQTELTLNMNTRAWLEIVHDIFNLHFSRENLRFDIPATLVNNLSDDILDGEKTTEGLMKMFPKGRNFSITLPRHSPKGPINLDFVDKLLKPLLPHIRKLSKNNI